MHAANFVGLTLLGRVEKQAAGVQISMAQGITVRHCSIYVTTGEADRTRFATHGCDAHSLVGDPLFVDPAQDDYRVREGSPALQIRFENFPMDQFGVQKAELKAIARAPDLPVVGRVVPSASGRE